MDLESTVQQIERRVNTIEQPPTTTLRIIGEPQTERYWERLLAYFIDSEQPHGFGTEVLDSVLQAIISHPDTKLSAPVGEIEQVEIQTQVSTGDGPFDILLWLEDEWFVCIEMKVASPESDEQTIRYAQASRLGDVVVDQHSGLGDYIYLAPENAPSPSASVFVDVSWKHIIQHIEKTIPEGYGKYPSKSTAQLADFIHTIKRELNMGEISEISEETALYFEYKDTIDRLQNAFESDKERLFRAVQETFLQHLEEEKGDWQSQNTKTSNYIKFYKTDWHGLRSGVDIEYEPHLYLNRNEPNIRLRLDIEKGNKTKIRDEVRKLIDVEKIQKRDWEITDGSYEFIGKTVPMDFDNPQESIRTAGQELFELHKLVGPHLDDVVSRELRSQ